MDTSNYTATITVKENPETAFRAIQNFRGWWSEDIEGPTDQLNETFFYHYKDVHLCKLRLIEDIPYEKLVYKIMDNQFSFIQDKTEWIGSELIFVIEKEDDHTNIKFTHSGLTPKDECFDICEESWNNYIKNSLYKLITTGKGEPNEKEMDGFNADLVEKWKLK
ncbi:MAG: SRPBCC domain-containing protein [Gelidibacter sp.]